MHCASEFNADNRGVGASKIDAAAEDGVAGSTPEFDAAQNTVDPGNRGVPDSTPEFAAATQNGVDAGSPSASELSAEIGVTIQARSARD